MESFHIIVAAVGTLLTTIIRIIAKAVKDIWTELRKCKDLHADCREETGSLKVRVEMLTQQNDTQARQIAAIENNASAAKQEAVTAKQAAVTAKVVVQELAKKVDNLADSGAMRRDGLPKT